MKGHDRRPRWKRAVYAGCPGMTDGCRVLLLRLLDDMNRNGVVSVPRSRLAAELGVAPARISERIKLARHLGYLDLVRRARPKVTAVYQATIPAPVEDQRRGTDAVPQDDESGVRIPVTVTGTESVPLSKGSEVRMYPTQEGVQAEAESLPSEEGADRNVASYENDHPRATPPTAATGTCAWCRGRGCIDCREDQAS